MKQNINKTQPFIDTQLACTVSKSQIPTQEELNRDMVIEANKQTATCEILEEDIHQPIDLTTLNNKIYNKKGDNLFFIKFVPEGTIRPKWFLVQVNSELTEKDPACFVQLLSLYSKHDSNVLVIALPVL